MQRKKSNKQYMNVNVILTFGKQNDYGDTQELFDLCLPISREETDAMSFLNNKLFGRIVKKCAHYGHSPKDLIRISTCSNWNKFKEITSLKSLCDLDHDCKWYFGQNRDDLDIWEKSLIARYEFGTNIDMGNLVGSSSAPIKMTEEVKLLLDRLMSDTGKPIGSS